MHENYPIIEVFENNEKRLNFERLREQLEASEGVLRVFVHPLNYRDDNDTPLLPEIVGKYPEMQARRDKIHRAQETFRRFLASDSPEKPPTIVFEEKSNVSNLQVVMSEIATGDNVYIIETEDGGPDLYSLENTALWPNLLDTLQEAGTEKIIIGGQSLAVEPGTGSYPELEARLNLQSAEFPHHLEACVAGIAGELARRFPIEISNIAAPDNAADIKKLTQV